MKLDSSIAADLVTLANGFVGLLAIMYIIDGDFRLGMVLVLIGILIDGADGILARYFKRKKGHGVYLDSIADTVTFSFAPSILLYGMFYNLEKGTSFQNLENALTVAACMMIVLFGILRLARFIEKGHKFKNFLGLPIPAGALIIVMSAEVLENQIIVLIIAILISLLMISKIPYPKLKGILGGVAGIVILIGIFGLWHQDSYSIHFSTVVLVMAIIYVVIGPLYAARFKGE
ncbi:MAG: CDP-diacylglycerol--serine O-phosphatidyltransferase [Methanomassiliicoccales archaeon]|nr:MAG: CDP-diacylglycerol--serine O-phosphatidyltransferase [Methanomassiliicoccales archaeon]